MSGVIPPLFDKAVSNHLVFQYSFGLSIKAGVVIMLFGNSRRFFGYTPSFKFLRLTNGYDPYQMASNNGTQGVFRVKPKSEVRQQLIKCTSTSKVGVQPRCKDQKNLELRSAFDCASTPKNIA